MCGHVRPLLAELLGTALFLTIASLGPGPKVIENIPELSVLASHFHSKAISWGVSYALSSLLAGPQAVLNPALSLAMVASRQVIIFKMKTALAQCPSHIWLKNPFLQDCHIPSLFPLSGQTVHPTSPGGRPACWSVPLNDRPDPHLSRALAHRPLQLSTGPPPHPSP